MNASIHWPQLAAALVAGCLLGWLYFFGLRMTVDCLPASRRPGMLVLASFVVRACVTAAAFVELARLAGGLGLAAALFGFFGVRAWFVHGVGRGKSLAGRVRASR